jgi:hypothetical protein
LAIRASAAWLQVSRIKLLRNLAFVSGQSVRSSGPLLYPEKINAGIFSITSFKIRESCSSGMCFSRRVAPLQASGIVRSSSVLCISCLSSILVGCISLFSYVISECKLTVWPSEKIERLSDLRNLRIFSPACVDGEILLRLVDLPCEPRTLSAVTD